MFLIEAWAMNPKPVSTFSFLKISAGLTSLDRACMSKV